MILLVLWLFKRMKKDLDIDKLSNIFSGYGEENVKKMCQSRLKTNVGLSFTQCGVASVSKL